MAYDKTLQMVYDITDFDCNDLNLIQMVNIHLRYNLFPPILNNISVYIAGFIEKFRNKEIKFVDIIDCSKINRTSMTAGSLYNSLHLDCFDTFDDE